MRAVLADITRLEVDVIVNAANTSLLGGGGVDGAIHRVAGPQLLEECRRLGGCPTGEARITGAYQLPAKFVVHTVGPVWQDGNYCEEELLASCYRNSLELALDKEGVSSIAFPGISTGVYGFPLALAAPTAVATVARYRAGLDVTFCCFSPDDLEVYKALLNAAQTRD